MVAQARRSGWDLDRSTVEGDLRHWGRRYQRLLMSTGFSSFNILSGLLEGRGGLPGSKVLIPDMSERAWVMNTEVWALPTDYAWALVARYCLPVKEETGEPFSRFEISAALECTPENYRQRLSRGRSKIQAKIFLY